MRTEISVNGSDTFGFLVATGVSSLHRRRLHQMCHLIPFIPDPGQQHPKKSESRGKSGSRPILFHDPTLAHGKLTLCRQDSRRQSCPQAEADRISIDESGSLLEVRNCPEDDLQQATNLSHARRIRGLAFPPQDFRKSLLYKPDGIFRGGSPAVMEESVPEWKVRR